MMTCGSAPLRARLFCSWACAAALAGGCGDDGAGEEGASASEGSSSSASTSDGSTSDGSTSGSGSAGETAATTSGGSTSEGTSEGSSSSASASDGSTSDGSTSGGSTSEASTSGDPTTEDPTGDSGGGIAELCFAGKFSEEVPPADYDQFKPTIGSHCMGTDHQTIEGVEKVIFLGDSVTRGTPDLNNPIWDDAYRFVLSKALAQAMGLEFKNFELDDVPTKNLFPSTDDFDSCAEWGHRTDDLAGEIAECFPKGVELKTTLIVMTIGGNDLAAWAKAGTNMDDPKSPEELLAKEVPEAVQYMRDAVEWLTDPNHFPNGSYVVFANTYEYTDRTGEMGVCQAAQWQDLQGDWPEGMGVVNVFNEKFMEIAAETQTDMIFMSEAFCGWGYKAKDPSNVCYDPAAKNLFDLTCIHPNTDGDKRIADMFFAVIDE
jgi:lysophospholipase L1-like esterase